MIPENILLRKVEFGTPSFDELLELRYQELRVPLNLPFYEEDIASEFEDIHLAAYDMFDNLLGCLTLKALDDIIIKMRQVVVAPDYRSLGIGKWLVHKSEEWAKDHGYTLMVLHARDTAISFYEDLDYSKVGEKFTEVDIEHYKMKKSLS